MVLFAEMSVTSTADDGAPAALAEYDVTAWLLSASCELPVGHFLHPSDGSFSLHAAMSALELMDRRMDPGMANPTHTISEQQRQRIASREQQLQWDDRQVLLCADTLLCCLASHLNGLSLPHSLYSFVLLHRAPYQQHSDGSSQAGEKDLQHQYQQEVIFPLLHHPVLRTLSLLMLHTSHACRSIVSRADLYEEEEWSMHDYGLAIEQSGGGEQLSKDATVLEQSLEAASRLDKKARQQRDQAAVAPYREAVLDRLRLCHALLLLLSHLSKPIAPLHTAHKLLARAATHLHSVMHSTLMSAQHAVHHVQQLDAFRASSECPFDPSISASLILHAPPRLYPLLPFPAALTLLHQMMTHTSLLLASCTLPSLPAMLHFTSYFASQRPHIVLRSLMLTWVQDETDVNRSGRSLLALLSDALHALSPSAALFVHPSVRWAFFGPLPSELPADLRALPPADLTSSWMSHMSTLVLHHFRLLLMDPTRERRKVGAALQLALHLQPAAASVDQWLALACRRLRIEQADGAWYGMANQLTAQQRRQLEEADRRLLYGSSYYSLALDAACSIALHQLTALFKQQLAVDEELSVLYFAIQHYAHCQANNARAAWRDDKLTSALIDAQQPSAAVATGAKKKRGKQQQSASKLLSVTPPASPDMMLSDCLALLSAGMQSLIHGLARLQLPSNSNSGPSCRAVAVPLLPAASLTTYFSNRFVWLPDQLAPVLSSDLYERQMEADFEPSLDAESILELSGRLFGRAKEQIAALQAACKQQPPLPACTEEALTGHSSTASDSHSASAPSAVSITGSVSASDSSCSSETALSINSAVPLSLPSARVALLSDLSARTVLPFDGAFLHSLSRVAVHNAVTATKAAKKAEIATTTTTVTSAPGHIAGSSPPFRAQFSFVVNWLFPMVSVEAVKRRPPITTLR